MVPKVPCGSLVELEDGRHDLGKLFGLSIGINLQHPPAPLSEFNGVQDPETIGYSWKSFHGFFHFLDNVGVEMTFGGT